MKKTCNDELSEYASLCLCCPDTNFTITLIVAISCSHASSPKNILMDAAIANAFDDAKVQSLDHDTVDESIIKGISSYEGRLLDDTLSPRPRISSKRGTSSECDVVPRVRFFSNILQTDNTANY